jgi:hypothetical protein
MAKTNQKAGIGTVSSKTAAADRSKSTVAEFRPDNLQASRKTPVGDQTSRAPCPTHHQIAERAKEIWRQKGCPAGQDEINWYEAETQLKQELAIR